MLGDLAWIDLAAHDAEGATRFYRELFGWTAHLQAANGGQFVRLRNAGATLGSLYQLARGDIAAGVPSHWTAYVRVTSADAAAERAVRLGGRCVVAPFEVHGAARIALIQDPDGALIGLWQDLTT